MKKSFAPYVITAALAGGAGALAFAPGFAGAQIDSATAGADSTAHVGPLQEVLNGLVSDGTLTQPQADEVLKRLQAARPARGGHLGGKGASEEVIAYLDMTAEEIRAAHQAGKSLADMAADAGKSVHGLIDVIVDAQTAAIDQAVTDGKVSEARATEAKANLEERVTNMVNGTGPVGGPGGPGGHRGPRGFGPHPGFGGAPSTGTGTAA